ncbi:dipeptidase [Bacteroidota bacterium]
MYFKTLKLFLIVSIVILNSCMSPYSDKKSIDKAIAIHKDLLTVDSHTDTPLRFFRPGTDLGIKSDSRKWGGKLDFPRMEEGGLDGVFFAIFLGQRERTPKGNENAKARTLMLFDSIYAVVERNSDQVEIALSSTDLQTISAKGKKAIYIGLENGFPLGLDISLVKRYFDLGARYITLCHTSNNDICDSSTDKEGPEHGGLSEFGREVVTEMNRLSMMIDVSHISDQAFYDVIETSSVPIIASHSNARAICDNPRNLNDDMLLKLAENGGVIQLCVLSDYVAYTEPFPERDSARQAVRLKYGDWNELDDSTRNLFFVAWYDVDDLYPPRLANVSQFCDHLDHIVDLIGIEHVGFGSDFDGGAGLADCYDVTQLPNVTLELLKRGYSKSDLQKFWSGNLLRVMKEVETSVSL